MTFRTETIECAHSQHPLIGKVVEYMGSSGNIFSGVLLRLVGPDDELGVVNVDAIWPINSQPRNRWVAKSVGVVGIELRLLTEVKAERRFE